MGMFQAEKFPEPKKSMFPLRIEVRPNRKFDISGLDQTEIGTRGVGPSFGELLAQKTDDAAAAQKKLAALQAALQVATLHKGTDHLPLNHIAAIEQIGDFSNQENKEDPNYVNYNTVLNQGSLTQAASVKAGQLKMKKVKSSNNNDDDELENEDVVEGQEYTYAHNLNLYQGASSLNPFKQGDYGNYLAFEKNDYFQSLTQGFMSPLRDLGQDIWAISNKVMDDIQNASRQMDNLDDPFSDNKIEKFTIKANYNTLLNSPDQWKQWDPQTMFGFMIRHWSDVKNYQKTIRSFSGKVVDQLKELKKISTKDILTKKKVGSMDQYISDVQKIVTELDKLTVASETQKVKDPLSKNEIAKLHKEMDEVLELLLDDDIQINLNESQKDIVDNWKADFDNQLSEEVEEISTKDPLLDVKHWWEVVGEHATYEGMLLPFGLMAETAGKISSEMDLGNWENSLNSNTTTFIDDSKGGFIDKAMSGYIQYMKENYLDDVIKKGLVSEKDFAIDNLDYGRTVFRQLQSSGMVSPNGMITNAFDPSRRDQELGLSVSKEEVFRIRTILRSKTVSSLNLELMDQTKINDYSRYNIQLKTPQDESVTLEEIIGKINQGDTLEERYKNTRDVYNVLFDMVSSMTDVGLNKSGSGEPKITKNGNSYDMQIYPKGSWEEYAKNEAIDGSKYTGWVKVDNVPITLSFKTEKEAQNFHAKTKQIVTLLEPLLASFDPTENVGPGNTSKVYLDGEVKELGLRTFVDNTGNLGENGAIKYGSPEYKMTADFIHHAPYFKTKQWTDVATFISKKTFNKIGFKMFEKNQINRFIKIRHRGQKEEFNKRKKEHEEKEYYRIKDEYKQFHEKIKKRKEMDRKYASAVTKRLNEIKAAGIKHQKRMEKLKADAKKTKKRQ